MKIILVNQNDNSIGVKEKLQVHIDGDLHRAFSVFIFNDKKQLLLQKRSNKKYHSPNLWTNTCCSHPTKDEDLVTQARNRLNSEMGFNTELKEMFTFAYTANVGNNLIENEYDHVFFGISNVNPKPNTNEVSDWKWIDLNKLNQDINNNPKKYTPWLRVCMDSVIKHFNKFYS